MLSATKLLNFSETPNYFLNIHKEQKFLPQEGRLSPTSTSTERPTDHWEVRTVRISKAHTDHWEVRTVRISKAQTDHWEVRTVRISKAHTDHWEVRTVN